MSSDGKCVSPVSGELKWNSDHVILVDWEFQEGNSFADEITYAPYVAKAKGEKTVFPKIELITDGSSIPLQESLYWAPNRVLAQAATTDGFQLMDPMSIQEPDQEDQKETFGGRLVHPDWLWLRGKPPSSQMWIPIKDQSKDACDDKYVDQWRSAWKRFIFPGSDIISKTYTKIDFMTNSPEAVVESFYTSHFPGFHIQENGLPDGSRSTVISLNEFDMIVWITAKECKGCSRTSVSIVGDLGQVIREQQQMLKPRAAYVNTRDLRPSDIQAMCEKVPNVPAISVALDGSDPDEISLHDCGGAYVFVIVSEKGRNTVCSIDFTLSNVDDFKITKGYSKALITTTALPGSSGEVYPWTVELTKKNGSFSAISADGLNPKVQCDNL